MGSQHVCHVHVLPCQWECKGETFLCFLLHNQFLRSVMSNSLFSSSTFPAIVVRNALELCWRGKQGLWFGYQWQREESTRRLAVGKVVLLQERPNMFQEGADGDASDEALSWLRVIIVTSFLIHSEASSFLLQMMQNGIIGDEVVSSLGWWWRYGAQPIQHYSVLFTSLCPHGCYDDDTRTNMTSRGGQRQLSFSTIILVRIAV